MAKQKQVQNWLKWGGLTAAVCLAFLIVGLILPNLTSKTGEVEVPALVGMSQEEATNALRSLHLEPIVVKTHKTMNVPEGTVTAVSPPVGRNIRQDRTVILFVSSGIAGLKVPLIVGQSVSKAKLLLADLGLTLSVSEQAYSLTQAVGVIIEQRPSAQVEVAPTTPVYVVVSKGSPIHFEASSVADTTSFGEFDGQVLAQEQHLRRILISGELLKNEGAEEVTVYFKHNGLVEKVYSELHPPSDKFQLAYEFEVGGSVEVYYSNRLVTAYQVPSAPQNQADSSPNAL